ncbi:MAG: hypothetical protein NTW87_01780 [Planctomycetota bacterium]|nr:hypothetical protein [Planctomycetota bacterium]
MTEEQRQPEFGWFRTPLAAGMLSGVLAGIASLIGWNFAFRVINPNAPRLADLLMATIVAYPVNVLLCSGPAIARRSWRAASFALLWGLVLCSFDLVMVTVSYWLTTGGLQQMAGLLGLTVFIAFHLARAGVAGLLLGLALVRLYGFKPYAKGALVWGAIGEIVVLLINAAGFCMAFVSPGGGDFLYSRNGIVVQTMSMLISTVVLVLFPTWAIERAMRKQPPRPAQCVVLL